MAKAGTIRPRFSLGSLGVIPFELLPLFSGAGAFASVNKGRNMKHETSNAERKDVSVGNWAHGFARRLVNRRTLIIALQILYWIVKIARLLARLMGNS